VNAIAKPQPHADAAGLALRDALATANAPLRDGVSAYRAAYAGLSASTDLLEVMRAAGSLVLAAESIVAASKQAEVTARTALANCMAETGCSAVALADHVVHLGTKPDRVDIEDERTIPPELMRQPSPAPDKVAIGKRLRAGTAVPGARLIGNREPICIFRSHTL
jgi:hypothetical protein